MTKHEIKEKLKETGLTKDIDETIPIIYQTLNQKSSKEGILLYTYEACIVSKLFGGKLKLSFPDLQRNFSCYIHGYFIKK